MLTAAHTPSLDDALLIVDVQNDLLPGGSLAVPRAEEVIAPLNAYLALFGTMAHAYVQAHDEEADAFERFARCHPQANTLLIDTYDTEDGTGHLRRLILADEARGKGLGRRLLQETVGHCDRRGLTSTYLWTFSGRDAARHRYESEGFRLREERRAAQWGKEVTEQKFFRPTGAIARNA